jgi:hypothetical protein
LYSLWKANSTQSNCTPFINLLMRNWLGLFLYCRRPGWLHSSNC